MPREKDADLYFSMRREPRRRIRLGIDQQKDYYLHNNRNNRLEQFCTQNCCKFFEQIAIIELRISVVCRSLDCSVGIGSAKVVRGSGHRSRGLGRSRKSGLHFTFACTRIGHSPGGVPPRLLLWCCKYIFSLKRSFRSLYERKSTFVSDKDDGLVDLIGHERSSVVSIISCL